MIDLVTIEDARVHLRIDDYAEGEGPDDTWLSIFIPAISQAFAEWVKERSALYTPALDSSGEPVLDSSGRPEAALDSNGQPIPKPLVRAAVLIELERQYRSRGGEDETDVDASAGYGYMLGKGSVALLQSLRTPTVS
ncbi:hypothetical protein [uncultured Halomonas sp.]|uniref:hypothetical protein n=1 Tax=uncultured Halomonas sp. TaxID=173971 RepID=UPI0025939E28|nr:hypothetical protein [uncultured Halomonas sp.]